MQTICSSLQTDNHTNSSSLNFYRLNALPNNQPRRVKVMKAYSLSYLHANLRITLNVNTLPLKTWFSEENVTLHVFHYISSIMASLQWHPSQKL